MSTCLSCNKTYKNAAGLAIHMRSCKASGAVKSSIKTPKARTIPAALMELIGHEADQVQLDPQYIEPHIEQTLKVARKRGKPAIEQLGEVNAPQSDAIEDKGENAIIINLVSKIHQLMYVRDQINGKPAYEDIIKLLFLRFIQPELKGKLLDLLDTKYYTVIPDFQPEDIALLDFDHLAGLKIAANTVTYSDRITLLWDMLTKHPLTKEIFLSKKFFNASMETIQNSIYLIHDSLKKIKFDELKTDIKGQIYEYFINKYSSGKDNEFGQYFTPRSLITLILGLNEKLIPDFKPNSIFDPCAGTCGFLIEMFKKIKCNPENIHGGEWEPNAYAAGLMNLLLTTGSVCNLKKCNSLEYMAKTSYDWIATNPPFGKKIEYDEMYQSEKISDYKLREIYPIKTNDVSSLFLQQCMKRLNPNGICNIVLPYGKIFNSAQLLKLRVHLVEQYKLCAVIVVQQQTFEHTGCGTAVLTFTHGKTDIVKFHETNQECLELKELYTVTHAQIKAANYNLLAQTYAPRAVFKLIDSTWTVKKLGEVCEFLPSTKHCTNIGLETGKYRFYNSSQDKKNKLYLDTYEIEKESVIIGNGGNVNVNIDSKFTASKHVTVVQCTKIINTKYLYYFLKSNMHLLANISVGATIKWINKTNMSDINILICSLEKQAEIVAQCETYDAQIMQLNETIESIKKSIRVYGDMCFYRFDDKHMKKLRDVCEIKAGKFNSSDCKAEGKYPFYTGKAKNPEGFSDNYCFDYPEYLIIIKGGGSGEKIYGDHIGLGKVFLVYGKSASMGSQLAIVPNKELNVKFVYYYMKHIKNNIMDLAHYTTGLGSINQEAIKNIDIPVFTLEKQQEIADNFNQMHQSILYFEKVAMHFTELKKNYLSQFFKVTEGQEPIDHQLIDSDQAADML
jgi:type I restriction-modification system DNA methylase subunit